MKGMKTAVVRSEYDRQHIKEIYEKYLQDRSYGETKYDSIICLNVNSRCVKLCEMPREVKEMLLGGVVNVPLQDQAISTIFESVVHEIVGE
jgi:hypothetical protein